MKKMIVDTAFAGVLFVGSIFLWFVADAFQRFPRYKGIDMDFWPKILLVLIAVLALAQIWQNIANIRTAQLAGASDEPVSSTNWLKMGAVASLVILYFIGMETVGFMISTVVFLFVAVRMLGYPNRVIGAIYPLAFTAVITIIFVKLLELPLPRGLGPFEVLSQLIY